MHVASTSIFEGQAPSHAEFRDGLAARLHMVPRFRQKLRFVPFDQGRPVWVDDPHLNLDYHVRQTALPPPGTEEQLRVLAARIFSQELDRSKPLWEMWIVEGLEGNRFAIIGKSHHALVDGVSGVDISTVLYDLEPDPPPPSEDPPEWLPRPEPSSTKLLGEALLERATSPVEIGRGIRATLRGPRQVASQVAGAAGAAGQMIGAGMSAPSTPFNVDIGPHRRFEYVQTDIAQLKAVKNEHGGTLNDVVLSVVTGALGNYLRARGIDTGELELRAMVPVSVRAETEHGALGNKVAAMMAPLPVWCEDPVERLHLMTAAMGDLKASGQAVGAQVLTGLTDFAPPTLAAQAARLTPRQRFFNLVVTNVPGPQFPLYLSGRRLLAMYPMVPLAQRQALCVGIFSYDGQLNFGLVGDYDAMADLDSFGLDLKGAVDEVVAATPSLRRKKRAAPKRKPAKPKSKPKAAANGTKAKPSANGAKAKAGGS